MRLYEIGDQFLLDGKMIDTRDYIDGLCRQVSLTHPRYRSAYWQYYHKSKTT